MNGMIRTQAHELYPHPADNPGAGRRLCALAAVMHTLVFVGFFALLDAIYRFGHHNDGGMITPAEGLGAGQGCCLTRLLQWCQPLRDTPPRRLDRRPVGVSCRARAGVVPGAHRARHVPPPAPMTGPRHTGWVAARREGEI